MTESTHEFPAGKPPNGAAKRLIETGVFEFPPIPEAVRTVIGALVGTREFVGLTAGGGGFTVRFADGVERRFLVVPA